MVTGLPRPCTAVIPRTTPTHARGQEGQRVMDMIWRPRGKGHEDRPCAVRSEQRALFTVQAEKQGHFSRVPPQRSLFCHLPPENSEAEASENVEKASDPPTQQFPLHLPRHSGFALVVGIVAVVEDVQVEVFQAACLGLPSPTPPTRTRRQAAVPGVKSNLLPHFIFFTLLATLNPREGA